MDAEDLNLDHIVDKLAQESVAIKEIANEIDKLSDQFLDKLIEKVKEAYEVGSKISGASVESYIGAVLFMILMKFGEAFGLDKVLGALYKVELTFELLTDPVICAMVDEFMKKVQAKGEEYIEGV